MENWENEAKIIAITGNIGSGKSSVAKVIEAEGYVVLYSDLVAKQIIGNHPTAKKKIKAVLGESIYNDDDTINKENLKNAIFLSPQADKNRQILNAIVHPLVSDSNIESIETYFTSSPNPKAMIFIESALAIESGMDDGCDYLIQVSSDEEKADERLTKKRGMSQSMIDSVRRSQLSQQEKERLSDFTIINNKSLSELEKSTTAILKLLEIMPPKFGRQRVESESKDN